MTKQSERKVYTITNRFMFGRIFSNPDNVRPLLEAVLGIPIGQIRYVDEEHTVEPSLLGRGVRMDVFVDDGTGTVYDVEMQGANEGDLPLRSRYLLSSFDRDRIERGEDYVDLGRSIVIFVCTFDPIGLGRRTYTVQPTVRGTDELFDDGTMRVFLNSRGAARDAASGEPAGEADGRAPSDRLAAFLSYVDGGGTMGDEWLDRLDDEVRSLNADPGWRDDMVSYELCLQDERRKGREEGLQAGREEGLQAGREEGQADEADLNARLVTALTAAGRLDELPAAILDRQLRAQLLEELGA